MFGKKELFGNFIEPACGYCSHGKPSNEGDKIFCPKMGVTPPHFHCKKYRYDPLRRVPTRQQSLPSYDQSDFEL